jgi:hypothetical protein
MAAGSGGDDVDLVALVRRLRPVGRAAKRSSRSPSTNTAGDRPGVRGRASAAASDIGGGVRSMISPADRE